MVSKMAGVIRLESGIQLKRCARHLRAYTLTSSEAESSGAKVEFGNNGDPFGGVPRKGALSRVRSGVPNPGGGVPKGEELAE